MKRTSLVIVTALIVLGTIGYLASKQSDGPPTDRNVPGATTENGKARITD
jgi:hypothetical protein